MKRLWRRAADLCASAFGRPSGFLGPEGVREAGRPSSPNGASSFHLLWDMPASAPLVEVSAVIEIVTPPAVPDLYFWALQVSFLEDGRCVGGGHAGLQWNRDFPQFGAVNWGGYASPHLGGGELPGSSPSLPGPPDRLNTRSFPWRVGTPYQLRIFPTPNASGCWRAEIVDRSSGMRSVIRDLVGGGESLGSPMVWSEVFADCSAPSVRVRWSDFSALDANGHSVEPRTLTVNYQRWEDGGCTNTTALLDGRAVIQATNTRRVVPQGTVLLLRNRE